MNTVGLFRLLARYNQVANERLYERCAELDDVQYRLERRCSFRSIHGLLNHLLLGDQIWMARFSGRGSTTPPLDSVLFDTFEELRFARSQQDAAIVAFFENMNEDFLNKSFPYLNNQRKQYLEVAPVAVLHFFNHQTHHRGQVHALISQAGGKSPSLDLHRILNP